MNCCSLKEHICKHARVTCIPVGEKWCLSIRCYKDSSQYARFHTFSISTTVDIQLSKEKDALTVHAYIPRKSLIYLQTLHYALHTSPYWTRWSLWISRTGMRNAWLPLHLFSPDLLPLGFLVYIPRRAVRGRFHLLTLHPHIRLFNQEKCFASSIVLKFDVCFECVEYFGCLKTPSVEILYFPSTPCICIQFNSLTNLRNFVINKLHENHIPVHRFLFLFLTPAFFVRLILHALVSAVKECFPIRPPANHSLQQPWKLWVSRTRFPS